MSELRAPDPTLTDYGADTLGLDVAVADPYDPLPTAHRITGPTKTACGFAWDCTHPVFIARWVAVPCRRCFPDAPPPGHLPCSCGRPDHRSWPDPSLSWQVVDADGA